MTVFQSTLNTNRRPNADLRARCLKSFPSAPGEGRSFRPCLRGSGDMSQGYSLPACAGFRPRRQIFANMDTLPFPNHRPKQTLKQIGVPSRSFAVNCLGFATFLWTDVVLLAHSFESQNPRDWVGNPYLRISARIIDYDYFPTSPSHLFRPVRVSRPDKPAYHNARQTKTRAAPLNPQVGHAQKKPAHRAGFFIHMLLYAGHKTGRRRYCSAWACSIILHTVSCSCVRFSSLGIHCMVTTGTGSWNLASSRAAYTCLGPSGAQP